MILSDFLLQQKNDDSDPREIIPISFNAYGILQKKPEKLMHAKMKENS